METSSSAIKTSTSQGLTHVKVRNIGQVSFATTHQEMLELQQKLGQLPHDVATSEITETLFLFEPSPVVTLGSGAKSDDILIGNDSLNQRGIEILGVDRGGEATYHGPGQLIAYPVLKLRQQERDLHHLLRVLETAVLETLEHWGIEGKRDPDHTGVWVGSHKIASIGLSVRRWVTGHGLALYISGDLEPFDWIVPCGIQDCPITSMEQQLGHTIPRDQVEVFLSDRIVSLFGRKALR
jgi:lipoate-protein ligase B